jgi:hypothetical protein
VTAGIGSAREHDTHDTLTSITRRLARDELNSANSTNVCCCPKVLPRLFLQTLLNVKGGEVELDFTGFLGLRLHFPI